MAKTATKSLPSPTKKRGRPKKEMTGSKEEVAAAKRARETLLLTGNSEVRVRGVGWVLYVGVRWAGEVDR